MRIKFYVILIMLSLLTSFLFGAVAKKLSLEFLVENASVIVQGKVKSMKAAWDKDKKAIWTEIEIEIEKTLKGDEKDTISVFVRGGQVGDIAQEVAGSANFADGKKVVVFGWKDSEDRMQILGMSQGKFKIYLGKDEEECVKNSLSGLKLVDDEGKELDKENCLPTEMKLKEFLDLIATHTAKKDKE